MQFSAQAVRGVIIRAQDNLLVQRRLTILLSVTHVHAKAFAALLLVL
jgi:hypothetical protein